MNRIPSIAAAVALIAFLLAAYLALSSRIARLEEASTGLPAEPARPPAGGINEFAALGYDGSSALRLRLSPRFAVPPAPSPFAVTQPSVAPPPEAPVAVDDRAPAPAPGASLGQPLAPVAAAETPAVRIDRPAAPPLEPAATARVESAPIVRAPEKPTLFAKFRNLVGFSDEPTPAEIEAGIREVLNAGTAAALANLGQPGGYANDPAVAIPLPQKLEAVRTILKGVGMEALMDDLQNRINRAAELAALDASDVLQRAVADLPLDDPVRLQARDDAATSFLRSRMTGRLTRELRPLVDARLTEVGAHTLYTQALGIYSSLPFVPTIEGDLSSYVTSRGLDGIFQRVKEEEQLIRANPQRHTTVALRAAFGAAGH